tara:strand:- start:231 stop:362 length:132 start_codon:yes stop_codon:yes gene_type:complete
MVRAKYYSKRGRRWIYKRYKSLASMKRAGRALYNKRRLRLRRA